jgi:hypothetical protein
LRRDIAADRVGYVVPHNPKVTASTTPRDVGVPSGPVYSRRVFVPYRNEDSNEVHVAVVEMNFGQTTR